MQWKSWAVLFDDKGLRFEKEKQVDLHEKDAYYVSSQNYGGNMSMNIMLIDDDKDCIMGLTEAIEPSGHECELYTEPQKAVAAYSLKNYDVVITDMKMPRMNGIQVLKSIRRINPTAKVIINTGYGDVETAIAAVNNGAYAFFGKPVDISDLLGTLEKINLDVEANKKAKEDHARLAMEYTKLKMAYEEMLQILKDRTEERERGGKDE